MAFYSTEGGLYARNNGVKITITNSGDNNFLPNTAHYKRIVFKGYPDSHYKTMSQGVNLWRVQTHKFTKDDWTFFLDTYLPNCSDRVKYYEQLDDVKQSDPHLRGCEFPEHVLRKLVEMEIIKEQSTIDYIDAIYNKTKEEKERIKSLEKQGVDGTTKLEIENTINPLKEPVKKSK